MALKRPLDRNTFEAVRSRSLRTGLLELAQGETLAIGDVVTFCESDGMPLAPGCKPGGQSISVVVSQVEDRGERAGRPMRHVAWA